MCPKALQIKMTCVEWRNQLENTYLKVGKLVSKHLTLEKICFHSPTTFTFGGSKGLGSPSRGASIACYKPPFGIKMSTIKFPKVKGCQKT